MNYILSCFAGMLMATPETIVATFLVEPTCKEDIEWEFAFAALIAMAD